MLGLGRALGETMAVTFVIGNALGTKQIDPNDNGSGESGRVDRILNHEFKQAPGDAVLIQSKTLTADDPIGVKAGDRFTADLFARLLREEYDKLLKASNRDVHDVSKTTTLPKGTHKFQCCIHPWMRSTVVRR